MNFLRLGIYGHTYTRVVGRTYRYYVTQPSVVVSLSIRVTSGQRYYPVKILQISKSFSIKPAAGIHQWKYCEKSVSVFVQSF